MFRSTKASRRSLSTAAFTLAVSTAVLALAVASTALAAFGADGSRRGLRAQPSPAIPNECINTGLDLQSSCTRELEMASQTFGLSPTADVGSIRVNMETLRTYLKTAPAPTAGCCAAAQAFNNVYCSCSPAVLDLVKSFTNNDINQYGEVAMYLADRCKEVGKSYTLYMGNTCPSK